MNEVSQGLTGNMEYVEFVVVDNTAIYDCTSGQPPTIDIRGWIFDDNSGYHGAGGIAAGCIRFSFDPLWSAVPMGTIILIYNDAQADPSIPPADISLSDGNCNIVAPISNVNLFESNSTTPGAVACSYPLVGWTPGGNWNNVLLANTGDCARIVNLAGCEVFSVCYSSCNANTLIYFANGAELVADHRNSVYYFNNGDPNLQSNWSIGCTDNEIILDANQCGLNEQTPGAPNNALNAAYIAQFNNGCTPIPPLVANAIINNHETCGCDGQATAMPTGSIPGYTYIWYDASMTPIGQTGETATGLCAGDYYVQITSSIDCQETVMVTVNAGPGLPTVSSVNGGATYCAGDVITAVTANVTGAGPWTVNFTLNGAPMTANGTSSPISLGTAAGVYVVTNVSDANCSNTASGSQTITINPLPTVTSVSGGATYCSGSAVSAITATVTGTGPWTVNYTLNGAPMTVNGPSSPISLGTAAGVYTVTNVSDANCSNTASGSQTITINTLPTVTGVNGGATYCTGDVITAVTANVTGSGPWAVNYTLNGTPMTANGASSPISLGIASGVYVVTNVSDANCSNAATGSQTITINPLPVITLTPTDPSACNLSDGSVLVSGSGSGTVTWNGTSNGSDATANLNYSISNLSAGNYNVYFINGSTGCQSTTVTTILSNPGAPVIDPITDQTSCGPFNLPVITGTFLSGNESFYSDSQANGGFIITGPITSSQTVWIYDQQGACSYETSFYVTIHDLPDAGIGGGGVFCNPPPNFNPVTIGVSNLGTPDYTLVYAVNGVQNTLTFTNPQNIYLGGSSGVNTFELISISDQFCTSLLSETVTVEITLNYSTPIIVNGDSTYCLGNNSAQLSVVSNGTTVWYSTAGDTVAIGSSILPPQIVGTTSYIVQQSVNNCVGPPAVVTVNMLPCEIIVPTAFTPDGDGVNEEWQIVDLDELYPQNKVFVYNRWGNLIFNHDSSIDGPYNENRWNGSYRGNKLPVGSYYYIIDTQDIVESITGTVSILLKD